MTEVIQTKEVNFNNDVLMAAQDVNGDVWVGVKWICVALGLTKDQGRYQVKNVQSDEVLKLGCVKFDTGVFDPNNETIAIKIEYLPLWLAKIRITPAMRTENPDVANKLVEYQLRVKDVLAAAFVPKQKPVTTIDLLRGQLELLDNLITEQERQNKQIEENTTQIEKLKRAVFVNPENWRSETHKIICVLACDIGGPRKIPVVRSMVYDGIKRRTGIDIDRRYSNKLERMRKNGASESQCKRYSKLDYIAEDPDLVKAYIAAVKSLAKECGLVNA